MPLITLTEDQYCGSSSTSKWQDDSYIALLKTSENEPPKRCYLKFYPKFLCNKKENKGIINEIIGYVLGKEMGVNVPSQAGIISISPKLLPSPPSYALSEEKIIGWWSSDTGNDSLKVLYNIDYSSDDIEEKLFQTAKKLAGKEEIHKIIAFDGLIANIDRNVGNILSGNNDLYTIIDHGQCLTGEYWSISDLDPAPKEPYKNLLQELIKNQRDYFSNIRITMVEHGKIVERMEKAISTLKPWLECTMLADDIASIEHFLMERGAPGRFASQSGLLI